MVAQQFDKCKIHVKVKEATYATYYYGYTIIKEKLEIK